MTSLKISDSFQVFIRESTHLHSYQYPRTSRALDSHKHCVKMKAFASLALAKMMLAEHLTVRPETESRPLSLPEQLDQFSTLTDAQKS